MKISDVQGDIRPKGKGYEMRCYNLNKKQVGKMFYLDENKSESQNAEDLQLEYLRFKQELQGKLQQSDRTFGEVANDWLAHLSNKRTEGTIARYNDDGIRVMAEFANCPIRQIQAYQIQKFIDRLSTVPRSKTLPNNFNGRKRKTNANEPLSRKSVASHLSYISCVFLYAIKFDMAEKNPCSKVELPLKEEKELEIYAIDEVSEILDLLYEEMLSEGEWRHIVTYYFVLTAFYTGARTGEILRLEWSDVENNQVRINKQSQYTAKGTVDRKTKSKNSVRVIKDIPQDFFNAWQTLNAVRRNIPKNYAMLTHGKTTTRFSVAKWETGLTRRNPANGSETFVKDITCVTSVLTAIGISTSVSDLQAEKIYTRLLKSRDMM